MTEREPRQYNINKTFNDLSDEAMNQHKIRLSDSLGTAIGTLESGRVRSLRRVFTGLGGAKQAASPLRFLTNQILKS